MEYVQPIRDLKKIEAMKKILVADPYHGARNHMLFTLGINSGLRISDLLCLKIGDVITVGNKIREAISTREQKTGKAKLFPINKSVQKAIQKYLDSLATIDPEAPLFPSRKGQGSKSISRYQAWAILNQAARAVGIQEKIGTHTLRKTFGYHAYIQGNDITLLQKVFNHVTPSVTLRYIGITQDEIDQVYINLNL